MNTLWKPCLVASLAMFLAACGREAADEAPDPLRIRAAE